MEPRFDDALSRAFYEPPGGQYSRSLQRYRDPMRRFYPSSVQMDGAGGSRRDGLADVSWLRAELRRLRSENAALQQEVKWQGQCILKSERKSRVLVSELGTLKRYAEKTELMNPQLCLVLVGLICDLLRSIGKQPTAQVYQIVPECLALIDQCPFVSQEQQYFAYFRSLSVKFSRPQPRSNVPFTILDHATRVSRARYYRTTQSKVSLSRF